MSSQRQSGNLENSLNSQKEPSDYPLSDVFIPLKSLRHIPRIMKLDQKYRMSELGFIALNQIVVAGVYFEIAYIIYDCLRN